MSPLSVLLPTLFLLLSVVSAGPDGIEKRILRHLAKHPCGRTVLTGNNGFIASHVHFGRRAYPRKANCTWRIVAPPNHRVQLFPTSMSLESDSGCGFDRLEVFDGGRPVASKRIGRICGGNTDAMFVSSGPFLTLRFLTDSTLTKKGFSLRYVWTEPSASPINGTVGKRSGRACTPMEFRCDKSRYCTPRGVLCDRLNDCGDESDERLCSSTPVTRCGASRFPCGSKGPCLPYHMRCDGVVDCKGREDETACGPDGVLAPAPNDTAPFDPSEWTRVDCGRSLVSPRRDDPRIVGGQVAKSGSWPWAVSLRMDGGHVCGGTIIGRRWVVTAAHCVEDAEQPSRWRVAAGVNDLYDSGRRVQVARVSRIYVHPRWNAKTIDYDLTLLRLRKRLRWTRYVRPACLPRQGASAPRVCTIAGWGDTKGTGGAGRLKQGRVRTFSNSQCSEWYGGGITRRMLCAGRRRGGVDSCQGDSGGPLVCQRSGRWVLHGATSFGAECGAPNSPGVYARVAVMRNWIRQRTGM